MNDKLLWSAVVLFVVIGSYIGIKKDVSTNDREAMVEAQIRTALPVGTDANEVVAYLNKCKIHHEELDKKSRQLLALYLNAEKGMFVSQDIQITFRFDAKNKLSDCSFKEVTNSLR